MRHDIGVEKSIVTVNTDEGAWDIDQGWVLIFEPPPGSKFTSLRNVIGGIYDEEEFNECRAELQDMVRGACGNLLCKAEVDFAYTPIDAAIGAPKNPYFYCEADDCPLNESGGGGGAGVREPRKPLPGSDELSATATTS